MKRIITPPSRELLLLYRILVALILALVAALLAGSLYALFRGADSPPLFRIGASGAAASAGSAGAAATGGNGEANLFSGIGRLRVSLAGEPAAAVIFSISFPYPADDPSFAEELDSRIGDFRSIAAMYFSSLPREKALELDEEAAKAEILERYNALLRLGTIKTLYFGDLMIVH